MNPRTVELVQASWRSVVPMQAIAADLFYSQLFELDPTLRSLFPSELDEQKRKLMQTLNVAVNGLGDLGALVPVLESLGQRHVGYGVEDAAHGAGCEVHGGAGGGVDRGLWRCRDDHEDRRRSLTLLMG
jgi:hemoglobin-like flavoprotein